MSEPQPPDLAEVNERMLARALAARDRAKATAPIDDLRAVHAADTDTQPVSEMVQVHLSHLDARIGRRYRHATPARAEVDAWLLHADDGAGLLLMGPVGTGKTWEAYGAMRAWVAAGHEGRVLFGLAADLIDGLRPDRGSSLDDLAECDLLMLDDLGVFKASEWTAEVLYRVLDRRWRFMLPTIMTTNQTRAQLDAALGKALASRVERTMVRVPMLGPDRRSQP